MHESRKRFKKAIISVNGKAEFKFSRGSIQKNFRSMMIQIAPYLRILQYMSLIPQKLVDVIYD